MRWTLDTTYEIGSEVLACLRYFRVGNQPRKLELPFFENLMDVRPVQYHEAPGNDQPFHDFLGNRHDDRLVDTFRHDSVQHGDFRLRPKKAPRERGE